MLKRWTRPLIVAIAIAALAVGCGDDGETEGADPAGLGKAEFIERANSVCDKARVGLQGRVSTFLGAQDPAKPRQVLNADLAHFVLLPTIEAQIWEIENLIERSGTPRGDAGRIDEMLDDERTAIDAAAIATKMPSIEAMYRRFTRSGKLFRAYGLSACSNGPQPAGGIPQA
jgi:hypothetical protein